MAATIALVLPYLHVILDDPFITFRYSWNASRGFWGVWNVGEPPIEGFTSTLWMMVNVIFIKAGVAPYTGCKVIGVLCVLAAVAGVFWQNVRHGLVAGLVAAGAMMLCPDVLFYSGAGMENIVCVLLGVIVIGLLESPRARHWELLAVLIVYVFLRPEGHLVGVCIALTATYSAGRDRTIGWLKTHRAFVASGVLVFVAPYVVRLIWFHEIVPNTYIAKHTGGKSLLEWAGGIDYLARSFGYYAVLLVLAAVGMALRRSALSLSERVATLLVLAFALYVIKVGGDDRSAFPGLRLFLPVVPFYVHLAVKAVLAVRALCTVRQVWWISSALLLALALLMVPRFLDEGLRPAISMKNYEVEESSASGVVGRLFRLPDAVDHDLELSQYLRARTPPGEMVAVPWAGRVSYETKLPIIDLLGLNDKHIARLPKQQRGIDVKYDPDYVLRRRPYFICENFSREQLARIPWNRLKDASEQELYAAGAFKVGQRTLLRHPEFAANYELDPQAPATCFRRRGPT